MNKRVGAQETLAESKPIGRFAGEVVNLKRLAHRKQLQTCLAWFGHSTRARRRGSAPAWLDAQATGDPSRYALALLGSARAKTIGARVRIWERLVRWLLFRMMFSSGVVKLTGGDGAWWGLTAMPTHYESQCLPTQLSW